MTLTTNQEDVDINRHRIELRLCHEANKTVLSRELNEIDYRTPPINVQNIICMCRSLGTSNLISGRLNLRAFHYYSSQGAFLSACSSLQKPTDCQRYRSSSIIKRHCVSRTELYSIVKPHSSKTQGYMRITIQ